MIGLNSAGPFGVSAGRDNSGNAVNQDRPNVTGDWRIGGRSKAPAFCSTSTRARSHRTRRARSATQAGTSCAGISAATSISGSSRIFP